MNEKTKLSAEINAELFEKIKNYADKNGMKFYRAVEFLIEKAFNEHEGENNE